MAEKRKFNAVDLVRQLIRDDTNAFLDFEKCAKKVRKSKNKKTKKKRKSKARCEDYWNTPWGRYLTDPQSCVPGTVAYKSFRNKFRMPCDMFKGIFMDEIIRLKVFPRKYDGDKMIPREIKCMIALRILGRGSYIDDINEMSKVAHSTINSIFKQFVKKMNMNVFAEYVSPPTGERLNHVMNTYARLGFPGAVGSVDCTHILWNQCPVALSNLCLGKEKYPSLSFEVVVDHERRIHSCTDGFVGTAPDKVIVVNDEYCRAIADGLYQDVSYSVYKADGTFKTIRGAYLISDGGYAQLWMFQRPSHNGVEHRVVVWSEFLESVRKDVECTFGILKARFHFLKHFVMYHSSKVITNAMKTCCILHNMLLAWDAGFKENWEDLDPNEWDADIVPDDPDVHSPQVRADAGQPPRSESGLGLVPPTDGAAVLVGSSNRHQLLEKSLQIHFEYAYKRGAVVWPKGFTATQRADFPLHTRGGRKEMNVLYKAPSFLRTHPNNTQKVGLGLFSSISFRENERIAKYKGVVMSREEYDVRAANGKGGYCIALQGGNVLDCYDHRDQCYASMANSALDCRTLQAPRGSDESPPGTLFSVANNCRLSRSNVPVGTVWLVANRFIPAHRELLVAYGIAYQLPA